MVSKKAFTLVELIVVLTILMILSTISFVVYTDYLKGVRDGNRLSQMSEIDKAMDLTALKSSIPFPDSFINVKAGGAYIGYQGYVGQSVLEAIRFTDGGVDPKTKEYFSYIISPDRKYSQILGFFEEQAMSDFGFTQSFAEDNSSFPRVVGDPLGILLEQSSKKPVQEVTQYISSGTLDILTSSGTFISYITNIDTITGQNDDFLGIVPNTNCKKMREVFGYNQNGVYKINPSGIKQIDVYCDMITDGGGWTLVARSVLGSSTAGGFGWLVSRGNIWDDAEPYSLGIDVKDIYFQDIMYTAYENGKIPSLAAWKLEKVDRSVLTNELSTYVWNVKCKNIYSDIFIYVGCDGSNPEYRVWGGITDTTKYPVSWKDTNPMGLGNSTFGLNNIDINGYPGMVFIR